MIFDTHCHVYDEKYIEGAIEVIKKSIQEGVGLFMIPGDNIINSKKAIELASLFPEVYCAIGVHPSDVESLDIEEVISQLKELYKTSNKIKAIGEIGLDYFYEQSPRVEQRRVFEKFLKLALEWDLPAMLHLRDKDGEFDAYADALAMLTDFRADGGRFVIHCYAGNADFAGKFLELDGFFGVTGMYTFKAAQNIREVISLIPLEKLFIETDAPYLAPVPYRGRVNTPGMVGRVAAALAFDRGMTPEAAAAVFTATSRTSTKNR